MQKINKTSNVLKFYKVENKYNTELYNGINKKNPFSYIVHSIDKKELGKIKYIQVGYYKHWCFIPKKMLPSGQEMFFSSFVLQQIVDFICYLYKQHRQKIKQEKEEKKGKIFRYR